MLTILFGLIAVILTAVAYSVRRMTLGFSATFAWLVFAIVCYSNSTVLFDAYWLAFLFGVAMTLAIGFESVFMRNSAEKTREEIKEEAKEEAEEHREEKPSHPMDEVRAKHGMRPSVIREKREADRRWGR